MAAQQRSHSAASEVGECEWHRGPSRQVSFVVAHCAGCHCRDGSRSDFPPVSQRPDPRLGDISLLDLVSTESKGGNIKINIQKSVTPLAASQEAPAPVPPPVNRFDRSVIGFTIVPVAHWDDPERSDNTLINVHTEDRRCSGQFRHQDRRVSGFVAYLLLAVSIAFLIVEIIALVIGVSLTRTITRAVHGLYEGTQRVMHGDFKHRITVKGRDQLADLGSSSTP